MMRKLLNLNMIKYLGGGSTVNFLRGPILRQAQQRDDETLDQFYIRFHHLAKNCEFTDAKKEIKTQLVQTWKLTCVRCKALQEDITHEDFLKYGHTLETSDRQIATMEHAQLNVVVNKVHSDKSCFFCGGNYPHPQGRNSCPAHGKTCNNCRKSGHFAKVCWSVILPFRKVQTAEYRQHCHRPWQWFILITRASLSVSNDDEFIFTVTENHLKKVQPFATIRILVDSGASVNMLDCIQGMRLGI